jgi:hypothetical protein
MMKKSIAALAVSALVLGACNGDDRGDGVIQQDTIMTTVQEPVMIERTVTVDTMAMDTAQRRMYRDTVGGRMPGDTLPGGTPRQ